MGKELPKITHKSYIEMVDDYEATATLAKLVYVSDTDKGIERKKNANGFTYLLKQKILKDKQQLTRIKSLAIPPAWEEVWICSRENGHIQATGKDIKNRKQYRYHPLWNVLRNETKFHKMIEFGKALPAMRLQLEKDLAIPGLGEKKVLATVLSVMERTYIRIGNASYEKMNGSFGLSTLKDKHVNFNGNKISFTFMGKKSVKQEIELSNSRLSKIVKQCRDIPGKELFQYYTEDGNRKSIDSGMVNAYIKELTLGNFSAKDFRTWAGCLHFLLAFKNIILANSSEEPTKASVNSILDQVSKKLGNTRTVCRKYYVHPGIIKLYEEDKLQSYLKELDKIEVNDKSADLTDEEKILMKLLQKM